MLNKFIINLILLFSYFSLLSPGLLAQEQTPAEYTGVKKGLRPEKRKFGVEIASGGWEFFQRVNVEDPADNSSEEQLSLESSFYDLRVNYPKVIEPEKLFLLQGLNFRQQSLHFSGWDSMIPGQPPNELYSLGYSIYLRDILSKENNLSWFFRSNFSGNFKSITLRAVRMTAGGVYNFSSDSGWTWGAGASIQQGFKIPALLPVFSLKFSSTADKQTSSPWRFSLLLPVSAQLWYKYSESLELGVNARLAGEEYYIGGSGKSFNRLSYSAATAGPAVIFRPGEDVSLTLETGVVFFHRLTLLEGTDKVRAWDFKPGWSINTAFSLSI